MHMVDLSWLRLKVYLAKNKRHVRARPGYIQFIQKRRLTAAEQNTVHDASDETEKKSDKVRRPHDISLLVHDSSPATTVGLRQHRINLIT